MDEVTSNAQNRGFSFHITDEARLGDLLGSVATAIKIHGCGDEIGCSVRDREDRLEIRLVCVKPDVPLLEAVWRIGDELPPHRPPALPKFGEWGENSYWKPNREERGVIVKFLQRAMSMDFRSFLNGLSTLEPADALIDWFAHWDRFTRKAHDVLHGYISDKGLHWQELERFRLQEQIRESAKRQRKPTKKTKRNG